MAYTRWPCCPRSPGDDFRFPGTGLGHRSVAGTAGSEGCRAHRGHSGAARRKRRAPAECCVSGASIGREHLLRCRVARGVNGMAVTPDGLVVTVGDDGRVQLWNTRRPVSDPVCLGQAKRLHAVALLSDGRIVTGGDDGRVQIWDPHRIGPEPVDLGVHDNAVLSVAALADGRVACGDVDGRLRLWDPSRHRRSQADRRDCAVADRRDRYVRALAVLPDGRVATGSIDRWVRIWEPSRPGAAPIELGQHRGGVVAVAALRDGRLATGARDNRVCSGPFPSRQSTRRTRQARRLGTFHVGARRWPCGVRRGRRSRVALAPGPPGRSADRARPPPPCGARCSRTAGRASGHWRRGRSCAGMAPGPGRRGTEGRPPRSLGDGGRCTSGRSMGHRWGQRANTRVRPRQRRHRADRHRPPRRDGARALVVLPDGRVATAGRYDESLRLWNISERSVDVVARCAIEALAVATDFSGVRLVVAYKGGGLGDFLDLFTTAAEDDHAAPRVPVTSPLLAESGQTPRHKLCRTSSTRSAEPGALPSAGGAATSTAPCDTHRVGRRGEETRAAHTPRHR